MSLLCVEVESWCYISCIDCYSQSCRGPLVNDVVICVDSICNSLVYAEGAVGKTSIMNRLCERGFNPTERPTMGTQLIQHPLGKLVIDIWDVAGQKSQFGSVKAKAK